MRKHHEHENGTTPAGTDRGWLTLIELHARSTLQAAGRLCFCVCNALNAPPASDRPADRARAQRMHLALASASIGR
ncbi:MULTISPECIES: hypothetical protein [unclassified Streptomyces]|uniref:hypothetical protein n=1 Tax=unclassified Streptomyces TaxID=2593676 RepID=UPI0004C5AB2A|nr:hypothetical protein [Streptomyces sp. NRRL F-2747]